jgi:hypothetical protein
LQGFAIENGIMFLKSPIQEAFAWEKNAYEAENRNKNKILKRVSLILSLCVGL